MRLTPYSISPFGVVHVWGNSGEVWPETDIAHSGEDCYGIDIAPDGPLRLALTFLWDTALAWEVFTT